MLNRYLDRPNEKSKNVEYNIDQLGEFLSRYYADAKPIDVSGNDSLSVLIDDEVMGTLRNLCSQK